MVVGMMGLYLAITRRSRTPFFVAVAGVVTSLVAVLVVIPAFNPTRTSPYAGYYSYLGSNMVGVVANLLLHPWIPLQKSLEEPEYLASLLQPFGYLGLLSPERLLLGLSSFLINILSADGEMQRPNLYHYTAPLIPALMLATIAGAGRAVRLLTRAGMATCC